MNRAFATARRISRPLLASKTRTGFVARRCFRATWVHSSDSATYELSHDFGDYDIVLPHEPNRVGVSHIIPLPVPEHIQRPLYAWKGSDGIPEKVLGESIIKPGSADESALRRSCALAAKVLKYAGTLVKVGVTTANIDATIHEFIIQNSAYPSPLLYEGYPRSCCTSVNNVVAHGVPDDRPLQNGDIVNIDVTVFLEGFHGDTSRTFMVGHVDKPGRELVQATDDALQAGISICKPNAPFKAIGDAIDKLARSHGMSVSSQFTGHGIGRVFHRAPWILHHKNDEPGTMRPGHCFTIEPCLVQGDDPSAWMLPDGWTTLTETCARSAQAEHTVLITESGVDVLTR